jgi:DNA-binding PadR family transcriptional regulator
VSAIVTCSRSFHSHHFDTTTIVLILFTPTVPIHVKSEDVQKLLPLKPLVFQVLVALADGERHGWALVRDVQMRGGFGRIMPGNFYRTLRAMLAEGLIEESGDRREFREEDDERRRYFQLTPLGLAVAAGEARRLESVLLEARTKRLLPKSRS